MAAEDTIAEAAAAWVARLDRGLTAEEQSRLEAWLAQDPRHWEEFALLAEAWRAADRAKESPELRQLAQSLPGRNRRLGWRWTAGAAAAAALALGFWAAQPRAGQGGAPLTYRVVPPEARTLTLADGSVVELRTGGSFRTDFS
ncbi:MAG TPA: DUF4880 domain-containing protein, partial [Opitutaceae bacterium]|nr:DUF4880 domain-containing protein [Opitutaceae bacterium]